MLKSRFVYIFSFCVLFSAGFSSAEECGDNEEKYFCVNAFCGPQKCEEKTWPLVCASISEPCREGCVCKGGYLRDESGVCIPDTECKPNPCLRDEEWSNCTQAVCKPKTCQESGKSIPCPSIADGDCMPACVCKPDWVRITADQGCIPENECNMWKDGEYIGSVNIDFGSDADSSS